MALLSTSLKGDSAAPALALVLALVGLAALWFLSQKRHPDAPWLRVSKKPGFLGQWEDRATFFDNPMAILNVGWERYSKRGINYMLDTGEGPRYVVAQKYFDELVRAPDTHVSALVASNLVS